MNGADTNGLQMSSLSNNKKKTKKPRNWHIAFFDIVVF